MALDIGVPLNSVLLLAIAYYAQRILFPSITQPNKPPSEFKKGYSWMPKSHPSTLLFETYTPKTLAPFNGKDNNRILLAIKGIVFDVTAGRSFYGPGMSLTGHYCQNPLTSLLSTDGPYGNFAGRDASRGMAKQSFDLGITFIKA